MTLNGVMAVILRYFSEFAYLPGVLRKNSRLLSHLLMSSCAVLLMPHVSALQGNFVLSNLNFGSVFNEYVVFTALCSIVL